MFPSSGTETGLPAPVVEVTLRTRAIQSAGRMTGFVLVKLLAQILQRVSHQRLGPHRSGLRTPIHVTVFIDIEIAAPGATLEGR